MAHTYEELKGKTIAELRGRVCPDFEHLGTHE